MNQHQSDISIMENHLQLKNQQYIELHHKLNQELNNIQFIVKENSQLKQYIKNIQIHKSNLENQLQILNQNYQANITLIRKYQSQHLKNSKLYEDKGVMTIHSVNNNIVQTYEIQGKSIQIQFNAQQQLNFQNKSKQYINSTKSSYQISSQNQGSTPYLDSKTQNTKLQRKIESLMKIIQQLKLQKSQLYNQLQLYWQQQNPTELQNTQQNQENINKPNEQTQLIEILRNPSKLQQVKYIGQIINGMKNGKGICKYKHNIQYQGTFKDNQRYGWGILKQNSIIFYKGYWKNGLFHGHGVLTPSKQHKTQFMGHFNLGKIQGYGTINYANKHLPNNHPIIHYTNNNIQNNTQNKYSNSNHNNYSYNSNKQQNSQSNLNNNYGYVSNKVWGTKKEVFNQKIIAKNECTNVNKNVLKQQQKRIRSIRSQWESSKIVGLSLVQYDAAQVAMKYRLEKIESIDIWNDLFI